MQPSLADRFSYSGLSQRSPAESMFREIVEKSPRRQEAILELAKVQVQVQQLAAKEIAQSNIAGAHIISNEISQQTRVLSKNIKEVGTQIAESVSSASEQISTAVNVLGDRVCGELAEVRWLLAQQEDKLEGILYTLQNSRSNEAKQLVKQGLRHLFNEEYDEAEERLSKALDFDTTDYQVLMNLAFVSIHKDDPEQAFTFFNKAINLPEELDAATRSETIWAKARLHYALENFQEAFTLANESIKIHPRPSAEKLYRLGVYAALSGQNDLALRKIEESICLESSLFMTAGTDIDLQHIQPEVLRILSRLSVEAQQEFLILKEEIQGLAKQLDDYQPLVPQVNMTQQMYELIDQEYSIEHLTYSYMKDKTKKRIKIRSSLSSILDEMMKVKSHQEKYENLSDENSSIQVDTDKTIKDRDSLTRRKEQLRKDEKSIKDSSLSLSFVLVAIIFLPPSFYLLRNVWEAYRYSDVGFFGEIILLFIGLFCCGFAFGLFTWMMMALEPIVTRVLSKRVRQHLLEIEQEIQFLNEKISEEYKILNSNKEKISFLFREIGEAKHQIQRELGHITSSLS